MKKKDSPVSFQGGLKAYDLACYFEQAGKEEGRDHSSVVKAMEALVVDAKTPLLARLYCMDVESANIDALQQVVVENGTALDCLMFARDVEQADVELLYDTAQQYGMDDLEDCQAKVFEDVLAGYQDRQDVSL